MLKVLVFLFLVLSCKHTGRTQSSLKDVPSPQGEGAIALAAALRSGPNAQASILTQADSMLGQNKDSDAATLLGYFYYYLPSVNTQVEEWCKGKALQSQSPTTARTCQTILGLQKKDSGATEERGVWAKWRSTAQATFEMLDLGRSAEHLTWPAFEKGLLVGQWILKPNRMLSAASDGKKSLEKALEFLDQNLPTDAAGFDFAKRPLVAKSLSLGTASQSLSLASWNRLNTRFIRLYTAGLKAQVQIWDGKTQDAIYRSSFFPMSTMEEFPLLFLNNSIHWGIFRPYSKFTFDANDNYFSIVSESLAELLDRTNSASALNVYYSLVFSPLASTESAIVGSYTLMSKESKVVPQLVNNLRRFSDTFHSKFGTQVGCSSDPLITCGPLQSIYGTFAPKLLRTTTTGDALPLTACPDLPNNEKDCHPYLFAGFFIDSSFAASVLQNFDSGDTTPLLNLAKSLSRKAPATVIDFRNQTQLPIADATSTTRTAAMSYLCLAYFQDPSNSEWSSSFVPEYAARSIFLLSLTFQSAGGTVPAGDEMTFYDRHNAPIKATHYCGTDMRLADPGRAVQEKVKVWVIDQKLFRKP